MSERVTSVEAVTVELPLPFTLEIAGARIDHRRYAVVEVRTDAGGYGCAIALTRNLPVAATVRAGIAPLVAGIEARADGEVWRRLHAELGNEASRPVGRRALSLVDIALWDATARRSGVPLWEALGGTAPRSVPVMIVGGYPRPGQTAAEEGARVAAYFDAGYPLVKVARQGDPATMARILRCATDGGAPPSGIVVDAAWAWTSPASALRELRAWDVTTLAWLEDPLVEPDPSALAELGSEARLPIGAGDEETDPSRLGSLVRSRAVDVLRVDVTTVGGFTSAGPLFAMAERAGIPVSTHVYPQIHVHAAVAFPGCRWIETFDPADNPFDPADCVLTGGVTFDAGFARPTGAPGLGAVLDRELIERHRVDEEA